jgi:murein DD-endopeptidase MepM/ murein hydrolase activator NlpD
MKHVAWTLVAALAAIGLAGCDREPPRTIVTPPAQSQPEEAAPAAPLTPPPADTAGATSSAEPQPQSPPQSQSQSQSQSAPPAATLGAQPAAPAADAASTPAGSAAPTEMSKFHGVSARAGGDPEGQRLLARHALLVPVAGIAPAALADNYRQRRAGHEHEAIDILAPAGTPVLAADDGRIAKLFHSKPGGLTIYQFDPAARLAFYYAHLQRYAQGVREGMDVRRGDVIGYVGSTGNADPGTPHLHFAVFRLGDPPKWWQGEAVNPYPALQRAQVASR